MAWAGQLLKLRSDCKLNPVGDVIDKAGSHQHLHEQHHHHCGGLGRWLHDQSRQREHGQLFFSLRILPRADRSMDIMGPPEPGSPLGGSVLPWDVGLGFRGW